MARNEEKHYGRLNRLYLLKEKEAYEKAHPKRPRLDTLNSPEEIQDWLPSIKWEIDFYLKKSQVTCYSDAHVEDCRETVNKLEREFKAFVRKIKQLTNCPSEAIPWTSRPYKRKSSETSEESTSTEFKRIATPILEKEPKSEEKTIVSPYRGVNWNMMDEPLSFNLKSKKEEFHDSVHSYVGKKIVSTHIPVNCSSALERRKSDNKDHNFTSEEKDELKKLYHLSPLNDKENNIKLKNAINIVNYESSDSDDS